MSGRKGRLKITVFEPASTNNQNKPHIAAVREQSTGGTVHDIPVPHSEPPAPRPKSNNNHLRTNASPSYQHRPTGSEYDSSDGETLDDYDSEEFEKEEDHEIVPVLERPRTREIEPIHPKMQRTMNEDKKFQMQVGFVAVYDDSSDDEADERRRTKRPPVQRSPRNKAHSPHSSGSSMVPQSPYANMEQRQPQQQEDVKHHNLAADSIDVQQARYSVATDSDIEEDAQEDEYHQRELLERQRQHEERERREQQEEERERREELEEERDRREQIEHDRKRLDEMHAEQERMHQEHLRKVEQATEQARQLELRYGSSPAHTSSSSDEDEHDHSAEQDYPGPPADSPPGHADSSASHDDHGGNQRASRQQQQRSDANANANQFYGGGGQRSDSDSSLVAPPAPRGKAPTPGDRDVSDRSRPSPSESLHDQNASLSSVPPPPADDGYVPPHQRDLQKEMTLQNGHDPFAASDEDIPPPPADDDDGLHSGRQTPSVRPKQFVPQLRKDQSKREGLVATDRDHERAMKYDGRRFSESDSRSERNSHDEDLAAQQQSPSSGRKQPGPSKKSERIAALEARLEEEAHKGDRPQQPMQHAPVESPKSQKIAGLANMLNRQLSHQDADQERLMTIQKMGNRMVGLPLSVNPSRDNAHDKQTAEDYEQKRREHEQAELAQRNGGGGGSPRGLFDPRNQIRGENVDPRALRPDLSPEDRMSPHEQQNEGPAVDYSSKLDEGAKHAPSNGSPSNNQQKNPADDPFGPQMAVGGDQSQQFMMSQTQPVGAGGMNHGGPGTGMSQTQRFGPMPTGSSPGTTGPAPLGPKPTLPRTMPRGGAGPGQDPAGAAGQKRKKRAQAGWLYKKNPRGVPGMRMWKRRWCVLRDYRIEYYTGQKDDVPKGVIDFNRILEVDRASDDSKHLDRFQIHMSRSKRLFEFKAATKEQCDMWIGAIMDGMLRQASSPMTM